MKWILSRHKFQFISLKSKKVAHYAALGIIKHTHSNIVRRHRDEQLYKMPAISVSSFRGNSWTNDLLTAFELSQMDDRHDFIHLYKIYQQCEAISVILVRIVCAHSISHQFLFCVIHSLCESCVNRVQTNSSLSIAHLVMTTVGWFPSFEQKSGRKTNDY